MYNVILYTISLLTTKHINHEFEFATVAYLGFHFGGGSKFVWKSAARGEATRLLGGFGGLLPRENFLKWCNLVRFREYFAKILSKQ